MLQMVLAIYMVLSAAVLALYYRFMSKDWLLRVAIVTAFPVIGWLFPLFWPRRLFREDGGSIEEYINRQQEEHQIRRIGIYSRIEPKKELDVIPIEDALLISGHRTRRRVMMDTLKQDAIHYLDILQTAVGNEDTETSHYAVSAIMEVKRKLMLAIQDLSVKYENDKEDEYVVRTYAEVLNSYMKSGFLDDRTLLKFQYVYIGVLDQLANITEDAEWAYQEKLAMELELGLTAAAEETGKRYMERYPLSEEAYLCLARVYYATKSADKLHQVLNGLKQTPIRLSNRALTYVRFWSEGA